MKNDFKHSDKRMQEKLSGFQMLAPEGAWAGIEGAIGGGGTGRKRFFFLWFALLLIGVTAAGILTFHYYGGNSTHEKPLTNVTKNSNKTKSDLPSSANTNTTSLNSNTSVPSNSTTASNALDASAKSDIPLQNNNSNSNSNASNSNANSSRNSKATNTTAGANNSATSSNGAANSNGNQTASNSNASNGTQNATTGSNNANNSNAAGTANNSGTGNNSSNAGLAATGADETPNNSIVSTSDENSSSDAQSNNTKKSNEKTTTELRLNALTIRTLNSMPISAAGPRKTPPFSTDLKMPRGGWSIEGGIDISSFNVTASGNDTADLEFLNNSYSRSNGQGGFLRVNYQPLKFLSVYSGFEIERNQATQNYSTFNTVTTFQYDTIGFYFDTILQQQLPLLDTTVVTSQVEQQNTLSSSSSQVNIPIGAMFHLSVGTRSELGVNLSGIVGIRTKSVGSILLDANGNSTDAASAYRTVNFSMRAAVRYSYLLNEHMAVYAEPHLGFGLNNQSNAALPFVSRFRNSGLRVGFRYKF